MCECGDTDCHCGARRSSSAYCFDHIEIQEHDAEEQYASLRAILDGAYTQAAFGKGLERHANDDRFEEQVICDIQRLLNAHCPEPPVGAGYALGQAIKKLIEAERLPTLERRQEERYGAINYIAARGIVDAEAKAPEA